MTVSRHPGAVWETGGRCTRSTGGGGGGGDKTHPEDLGVTTDKLRLRVQENSLFEQSGKSPVRGMEYSHIFEKSVLYLRILQRFVFTKHVKFVIKASHITGMYLYMTVAAPFTTIALDTDG